MLAPDLKSLQVSDLFELHGQILSELRRRGVVRSTNNPIADYAEYLCARALSLKVAAKSTKGFDAVCPAGKRYEIKARRVTSLNKSRELSAIRGLDPQQFDYLIGILFREDFRVWKACVIPHSVVKDHAAWSDHTNAWRFHLRDTLWSIPGVLDLTGQIQEAQSTHRPPHAGP